MGASGFAEWFEQTRSGIRHFGSGHGVLPLVDQYIRSPSEQREWERLVDITQNLKVALSPRVGDEFRQLRLSLRLEEDAEQFTRFLERTSPLLFGLSVQVSPRDAPSVLRLLYDDLIGLGPLGPAWRDPEVTEIFVDGPHRVYLERNGHIVDTDLRFRDLRHAQDVARALVRADADRMVAQTSPLVSAVVGGARVNVVYGHAVCPQGVVITIRKPKPLFGMAELLRARSLSQEMREFLDVACRSRLTILVAGGTGVGKTTLVNGIVEAVPPAERIITIEDVIELSIDKPHCVRLQTKERSSGDDTVIVDQEQHLVNALRMRPDRIIVGEIREPRAAAVMLQAASTGHEGTITTIHADDPGSAINNRLAWLVAAGQGIPDRQARLLVAETFDLVVQVKRLRHHRFIGSIAQVLPPPLEPGTDRVRLQTLFTGSLPSGSNSPVFQRVGSPVPNTPLFAKLQQYTPEAVERWFPAPPEEVGS